jgi:hypothetical protein
MPTQTSHSPTRAARLDWAARVGDLPWRKSLLRTDHPPRPRLPGTSFVEGPLPHGQPYDGISVGVLIPVLILANELHFDNMVALIVDVLFHH